MQIQGENYNLRGDRRCDDDTVHRLMAERVHDSRDIRVIKGSSLSDLDMESLRAYRKKSRRGMFVGWTVSSRMVRGPAISSTSIFVLYADWSPT